MQEKYSDDRLYGELAKRLLLYVLLLFEVRKKESRFFIMNRYFGFGDGKIEFIVQMTSIHFDELGD